MDGLFAHCTGIFRTGQGEGISGTLDRFVTYGIAMRHFLVLTICAGLVWLAVLAAPLWVDAVLAGANASKQPTPPPEKLLAPIRCHNELTFFAMLLPLPLAWGIGVTHLWRTWKHPWWAVLLRATLETTALLIAMALLRAAWPQPHPLAAMLIERCGQLR